MVFGHGGPGLDRLLDHLDGCHSLESILANAAVAGYSAAEVDGVLQRLRAAGLLLDGPAQVTRARIRLIGAGALARDVADLLAGAGAPTFYIVDNDAPDPHVYPASGALGTQADALRAHLGQHRGPSRSPEAIVVNHWSKPERVPVDLTILLPDAAEPDRAALDGLVRADQAHLVVRTSGDQAVVGPLVRPGETSCVRCTDLQRADVDPAWPVMLGQLCRTVLPAPSVLRTWAAATCAAQVLAFLGHGHADTCGATVELSGLDHVLRWRSWPPHRACGCHWHRTAEWSA